MPALARGDEERLLHFVAEAESFCGGDHPFSGEFLTQLGQLVPADWVGFDDYFGGCGDDAGYFFERPGDEAVYGGIDWAAVIPVVEAECPFLCFQQGGFGAVKISDFLTRRELHRTRTYDLVLKPSGLEDALAVRLPIAPPGRTARFAFDRGGRGFRARDCAVLDALNPHLVRLQRASEARQHLREALALHESTKAAVVLLEADDRVAFASSAARELLDRYLGENGVGLPDRVTSWLGERRRRATSEPLRIDVGGRALVVELVDGALLLEEQQHLPRLTPREREILDLVAEGSTNTEIGERLWISLGTVRKHLDHVYAKLGVHTRTAAAAFVRERRLAS